MAGKKPIAKLMPPLALLNAVVNPPIAAGSQTTASNRFPTTLSRTRRNTAGASSPAFVTNWFAAADDPRFAGRAAIGKRISGNIAAAGLQARSAAAATSNKTARYLSVKLVKR